MVSGPTWTPGKFGPAVGVTGGAHIDLPFPALATSEAYTLVVTHRPTTWPGGFTCLMDDASRVWSGFFDTSGNQSFGSSEITIGSAAGMAAGGWWQFVYTRPGGGTNTVYVNGVQKNTSGSASSASAVATTVSFGSNPSGGGSTYNGTYDSVRFWKGRSLTPAEVKRLYAEPFAGIVATRRRVISQGTAVVSTDAFPAYLNQNRPTVWEEQYEEEIYQYS